jgi:hypothetical protein
MKHEVSRRALLLLPLLGLRHAWSADNSAEPRIRPPAPTLRPSTAKPLAVDAQGFIRRWRVQEPIAVSGRLTQPDIEQLLQGTPFPPASSPTWHALDTTGYNFNLYHFAWAMSKPTSNVLFWATTTVEAPTDLHDVRLAIGSNAASAWWLAAQRVISLYNDRQTVVDDGVSRRLQLAKGRHDIRVAIINAGGATDFCARFLDSEDRPLTTLIVPAAQG